MRSAIVLCVSLFLCSFRLPDPYCFSLLSDEVRKEVIEDTWKNRDEIIQIVQSEDDSSYEEAKDKFFHVFHQMLLVDSK